MNTENISMKRTCIYSLILLLLFLVGVSYAEDPAVIHYQNVTGNKVVFTVEVATPAPSTLIVQHYHTAGNDLVAASPRAQQIDNKRGYSKWLLRNVRPGVYPFSLTFSNAVRPGDLQLILRYRDPQGGGFFEKFSRP
jgi:hypothetical protein